MTWASSTLVHRTGITIATAWTLSTQAKTSYARNLFTINAQQAKEIFEAARAMKVYVAEAMWLRRPLVDYG